MLPGHIVRLGSDGPERWSPQNVHVIAIVELVGQVGRAPTELPDRERLVRPRQPSPEVGGKGCFVEALVGANGDGLVLGLGNHGAGRFRVTPEE